MARSVLLWFSVASIAAISVCEPPDTSDFFPDVKHNLTKITWAHAVNNASYLERVLQSTTMMIEADVVLGTLIDDPSGAIIPIMGHPPVNVSDLSLERFLTEINVSNHAIDRTVKGVKLDFKSIEVFERSLVIVDDLYHRVNYPVWINADILPGPVDSQTVPVDADRFLDGNRPYPKVMLSVGWTTRYGGDTRDGEYLPNQIDEMLQKIDQHRVPQKCTFPVRAGLAANSLAQMLRLLSFSTDSTLTVWSGVGDYVDIAKLRELIVTCGLDKIYLDVPDEISDQLHL